MSYRWEDDENGGSILYLSPFYDEEELGFLRYDGDDFYLFIPSMRSVEGALSGTTIIAESLEVAKQECISEIRGDLNDEAVYYEALVEALDD